MSFKINCLFHIKYHVYVGMLCLSEQHLHIPECLFFGSYLLLLVLERLPSFSSPFSLI